MNARIAFPDIARGIAILMVICWHTLNVHFMWMDTWTMPIFFFIMGMFFKPSTDWKSFIAKKADQLLVPFFLLSVPAYLVSLASDGYKVLIMKIIDPYHCTHSVSWFLLCMFWCYILFNLIFIVGKKNKKIIFFIIVTITIINFYLSTIRFYNHRIVLPYTISGAAVSLIFVYLGYVFKDIMLRERSIFKNALVALSGLAVGGGIIYLFGSRGCEIYQNYYYGQSYFLYVANGLIGCITILFICKLLHQLHHTIGYIGNHSLLMLMIHPYVYKSLKYIMQSSISYYILTIIITLLIVIYISRFFPLLEGKGNMFRMRL